MRHLRFATFEVALLTSGMVGATLRGGLVAPAAPAEALATSRLRTA